MQKQSNSPTVLIAPLNWGLGHATRCVPIINCLLRKKIPVLIASDGAALDLLKKEFPQITTFSLPGYNVEYPYDNMAVNMLLQFTKIQRAISKEHKVISKLVTIHNIDIIISDNRFGCYSAQTYNVFMTHQLNIMAPFAFAEKVIAWWNKKMLNRFDLCWVPDFENAPGLAGKLSHPSPITSVRYLGPLSRMQRLKLEKRYDAIAVLSGPEPQRTKLERLILQQAVDLPYNFLLVRGKITDQSKLRIEGNVSIIDHLKGEELAVAIAASEIVIARSGYTTIMDLIALEKKAILIPTPGQTEQVYLGELFSEQNRFLVQQQINLDLEKALDEVKSLAFPSGLGKANDLDIAVKELLENSRK